MKIIATVTGYLVQLSPRECQIGRLLAHGSTNKVIGHNLGISPNTVKGHMANMTAKLLLANRVQLSAWLVMHPESVDGLAVDRELVLPFESAALLVIGKPPCFAKGTKS
jgi:DNA-binding CsgD family transcriptional regulator